MRLRPRLHCPLSLTLEMKLLCPPFLDSGRQAQQLPGVCVWDVPQSSLKAFEGFIFVLGFGCSGGFHSLCLAMPDLPFIPLVSVLWI